MIYKAAKIFLEEEVLEEGYLRVEGDRFGEGTKSCDEDFVDLGDNWIVPGLFDTHIHGYGGVDFMVASSKEISRGARTLARTGVTSFLPTTTTAPWKALESAMERLGAHRSLPGEAKLQGIHSEGPFLSKDYAGAQDREWILSPEGELLEKLQRISRGRLLKLTLAPELPGVIEMIRKLSTERLIISLGHSAATYEETLEAVKAGGRIFTHLFNGMKPFHHREPGIVGAALTTPGTYCEVIADGVHLHEKALELALWMKGSEEIVLVSDALMGAGMADGVYALGEQSFTLRGGRAVMEDGTLAGGTSSLWDHVKFLVDKGLVDVGKALEMATIQPARSMGLEESVGSIKKGKAADFLVVDRELRIRSVFIDGRLVS